MQKIDRTEDAKGAAHAEATLNKFLKRYKRHKRAISVNFRRLVTWPDYPDHATHLIHPYPAKLLPHIPRFFLSSDLLSKKGDVVLDPFCGSGTVLLEAMLADRRGRGADANPLARLISRVKITPLSRHRLERRLKEVIAAAKGTNAFHVPPDVVNIDYWFYPHVVRQLSAIRAAILRTRDQRCREFLLACFSVCVRRVSRADPRLSVPVRLRHDQYAKSHPFHEATSRRLRRLKRINVFGIFQSITQTNISRLARLEGVNSQPNGRNVYSDARRLACAAKHASRRLSPNSVQLVITSPPYAGAQKYVRASSLSLGWLGLCRPSELRNAEDQSIGREHFRMNSYAEPTLSRVRMADAQLAKVRRRNPLRAHIAAVYLNDMRESIRELWRVLAPGGYVVFVVGDNRIAGRPFRTTVFLRRIFEAIGFKTRLRLIDTIHSRGLMTKRNKTAGVITREWVFVFQKPRPSRANAA